MFSHTLKYLTPLFFTIINTAHAFNMAYVEINSNAFKNVGCYVESATHEPFFQIASIFAANINGNHPNEPIIHLNNNVITTLESGVVEELHKKGVKVLVTLLGNHQNAGWSCMTDAKSADLFAEQVVGFVKKYNLDGIDIDDEYSKCSANNYSMIMMAKAIKSHPEYQGKLLTKALFHDVAYFNSNYQGHFLKDYLDYGWEMSYWDANFSRRITPYIQAGMPASRLMIGGWVNYSYPSPNSIGKFTTQNNLTGVMVYDIKHTSQNYLTGLLQGMNNGSVTILPNCLS